MSVRQRLILASMPLAIATLAIIISSAYMGRGPSVPVVEAITPTHTWTSTATPAFGYYAELDCFPQSPTTQNFCQYPWNVPADIAIDVVIGNNNAFPVSVSKFSFEITSPGAFPVTPGSDNNLNAAPDFNEGSFGAGWTCTPPPPVLDSDPDPNQTVSFLSCYTTTSSFVTLPAGGRLRLATLHYNPYPQPAYGAFWIRNVVVEGASSSELFSCYPIVVTAGTCSDANIQLIHVFPTATWTSTPTPTNTPTVTPTATGAWMGDSDGDGIPGNADNCPFAANPGQENNDRNFISNAPVSTNHDHTRAHSDPYGDVCDGNNDNDAIYDHIEIAIGPGGEWAAECPSASAPTDPWIGDTDGDRYLDGVECALGTDPASATSAPAIAACGPATDADNDGLSARLEYCFYNTDPTYPETDGDGAKDGCEAMSVNADNIANVADLGMVAVEVSRAVPPAQKLANLDVNKDGAYNPADLGMVAARVGKCP